MRVGSLKLFAISVTLVASVVLAPSILAADSISSSGSNGETTGVQVQSFHSHGRLTVAVDESVETELKTTAKGFEIFLKGIGLSDLGAPLGEEEQWVSQFQSIREPRLATLNFKEVSGGLRIEGTWKYPAGKGALASPSMDTFDFRKNTPAQYVLDFWLKPGPTLAEVEEKKNKAARQSKLEMADAASRLRATRRLASEKQKSDLEDVTRFCREPLSEATDIFLPTYPVHTKVSFSRWFPVTTPDSGYSYFEPVKATDGPKDKAAEYVRLALDLYRKGDPALVVRTLDFFDAEEPASEYRHEMRFLRANAMIRLGLQDAAEKKLREIVAEEKESPVSLLAAQYLAAKQYERGQFLAAAENFLWLETHYPTHRLAWVFHLGTAESLYALKQTERSAKEYQWIIENAQDSSDKAEAALRQGDLYMERFQYDQGLASYFQGLTYFKDEAKNFPAIFINRAEALYGLAQYDRAEEAFQAFLKDYPAHPAGWRATFRIGEIEGRKAEAAARDSSRKWFYDTINRYPTSPGATLARLRLLPCGDHGRFDNEAMERFFDGEAADFDGGGEVGMPKFRAFEALAHIRTLVTLGREPEAVELASDELRATTAPDLRSVLGSSLGAIFRRSVLTLLDAGKKYEALSLYEQKYDALPKPDLITDPAYLLTLSRTASDLGLGELGERINQSFLKADAALKSGLHAVATSSDGRDLESDLRASERNFSEAKSEYVSAGGAPDVKTEGKIRELLATVESESRFSYEKELILGLLDQKKKEIPSALAHAAKAQILSTSDPRDYRVDAWLGSLQAASGEPAAALETYRNLEKHLELENATHSHPSAAKPAGKTDETIGLEPVPSLGEVLIAQSEILEKMNRWGDAATTYARAMDEGVGGDHVVYGYARALLRTGVHADRTKAYTVLHDLASGKIKTKERAPAGAEQDSFWRKLAQEALANEQSEREILGPVTKEGSK